MNFGQGTTTRIIFLQFHLIAFERQPEQSIIVPAYAKTVAEILAAMVDSEISQPSAEFPVDTEAAVVVVAACRNSGFD